MGEWIKRWGHISLTTEIAELAGEKREFSAFSAGSAVKWLGKPTNIATPSHGKERFSALKSGIIRRILSKGHRGIGSSCGGKEGDFPPAFSIERANLKAPR
jgi:hypothetical protein